MATHRGRSPLSDAMKKDARAVATRLTSVMKKIGNIVVKETVANFKRQGFMDRSLKPWKKRKNDTKKDEGRAILTGKANNGGTRLRRSIKTLSVSAKRVRVGAKGSPAVYAGVHNYGLKAGRGKGFKMPKRQFLGQSHTTDKKIVNLLKKEVAKGFNN